MEMSYAYEIRNRKATTCEEALNGDDRLGTGMKRQTGSVARAHGLRQVRNHGSGV